MPHRLGIIRGEPGANLRAKPRGTILVGLVKGTKVHVTGKTADGWWKVRCKKLEGYVYGPYVTIPPKDMPKPAYSPKPRKVAKRKPAKRKRVVLIIVRRKRRYK
jgi:uncharacterized protein YgiM (DUF1202 family)